MTAKTTVTTLLRRRVPLWLLAFAFCLLWVYVPPIQTKNVDVINRLEVARNLSSGQGASVKNRTDINASMIGADGKSYNAFGIGQSLVFIPIDVTGNTLTGILPLSADWRAMLRESFLVFTYLSLVNLLLALVTFAVLRRLGLSSRTAATGTVVLFVCTQWLMWGKSLQEETLAALLIMTGLYIVCGWRTRLPGIRDAMLLGLIFGFLANVRYNGAFAAAAVLFWGCAFVERRRLPAIFGGVFIGVAPGIALVAWYNYHRWGSVFETGYGKYAQIHNTSFNFDPSKLAELVISPDFGLVWFAPCLLLCAVVALGKSGGGG